MDDAVVKTLDPDAAKDYSEMMESADYTIVIHCTHGVNRSGVYCCFLIRFFVALFAFIVYYLA